MEGIAKIIDELGLIILAKELELKAKHEELKELGKKIELIEQYLDAYEEFYNK